MFSQSGCVVILSHYLGSWGLVTMQTARILVILFIFLARQAVSVTFSFANKISSQHHLGPWGQAGIGTQLVEQIVKMLVRHFSVSLEFHRCYGYLGITHDY